MKGIRILFEDTHLIVLSKPAGLLVQGERKGDDNLVDRLRDYFGRHYVGLVHRLDRNTSGLMVVAKRSKSAARLSEALREGKVEREYLAVVEGEIRRETTWRHWLVKNESTNTARVVPRQSAQAKEAITNVIPLKTGKNGTLVRCRLETGRSHQIRVQAAFEGHPLAGDPKYGKAQKSGTGLRRPALHSHQLRFPHPMSGEMMAFEDPLAEDLKGLIS